MEEKELIAQLEALGWRYSYVFGHGDTEPVGDGKEYVIGDIEKKMVLVPPDCLFEKPERIEDYF